MEHTTQQPPRTYEVAAQIDRTLLVEKAATKLDAMILARRLVQEATLTAGYAMYSPLLLGNSKDCWAVGYTDRAGASLTRKE